MCGIAGIWGEIDPETTKIMMKRMTHRGPDAEGIFTSPESGGTLGHTRLSIMDPEGGDQPIYSEDKSKVIVANGEIYNFPDMRPALLGDHSFSTTSDTEAILHLYEDRGTDIVSRLDGMYAFVIADGQNVFAARDPIGIKPLYYGKRNGSMVFGSELKAMAGLCDEITEFPPGTYYSSAEGFKTFFEVPKIKPQEYNTDAYIRLLRRTLEDAVTKRLMSDVPLGTFLSGGLDSSIITAVTRQHVDELHTFSVGVEGSSDLEAARLVSKHLDTIHHEYVITPEEVMKELPNIIYYLESFDQDLVRSGIPCYFTSRMAADYVKVILTGEGADELFAGYTYYKDITDWDILSDELRRSVASLHNINLQRVDRMTMAHSIEGRVPFLDLSMIMLGALIPPELKLYGDPPVEKWVLRRAFEDMLPHEIVWRDKVQFDEGSGVADFACSHFDDGINTLALNGKHANHGIDLRSEEEKHYYMTFVDVFDEPKIIQDNVARWADRPV